ncbi:hypothetical protein R5R35_013669 [Gryllus longicercus]|uniref:HAT C-terminal dimerisation domain-containing protein n=1 Tax=Gryllus longicercus TaxID=2509291 RepID=A0AAN9VNJ0_9ORTH
MNAVSRTTQMDVHLRFWDHDKSLVTTRYFDSVFLKRTRAVDLLDGLKGSFGSKNLQKILQLSMDGPNVNLKLLSDLNAELRTSFGGLQLLQRGSCSLHVVHNAFKTGMSKTSWEIVPFLRSSYNLFHDSPARRALYTEITRSTSFPDSFCGTRWVENANAAEKAAAILGNVRAYVEETKKAKSVPQSWSFETVCKALSDELLEPKLTFFSSTARILEPFLNDFQSDDPIAPFLYDELHSLLNNLMQRVVKPDVLRTAKSLVKIDVQDAKNLITAEHFELDFATRSALKKVKGVSEKDVLLLKNDMRSCIIGIILKMQEKSPLKYSLTRALSCLDPAVALDNVTAERRLSVCLDALVSSGRMPGSKADRVKMEFVELCKDSRVRDEMKSFNRSEGRLDRFWVDMTKMSPKPCPNFLDFLKTILIISHGNASVERGFSVNSECIVENQTEKSLVAQRYVYDAVQDAGGVDKFNIDKSLIHSFRNAHSLYKDEMKTQKNAAEREDEIRFQNKRKQSEIHELEAKREKMLAEASKISAEIEDLKK